MRTTWLTQLVVLGAIAMSTVSAEAQSSEVVLIHTGDFHGHLIPRPNVRSDRTGNSTEGGLARIATLIKRIRAESPDALLLHTGDTIQGSAEALYTQGQAVIDVVNLLGVDAYAPGNWEFVYGAQRFLDVFAGPTPLAPWNALAANLFFSTLQQDPTTPFPDRAGQRVLPPYLVKQVGDVRVGVMGFTTDRGLPAMPRVTTKGFFFVPRAEVEAQVDSLIKQLRDVERCQVVVMISELGLAANVAIAETHPGIDVILSSDMHEASHAAIETRTGTLVVEEGQDGTMLGRVKLTVAGNRVLGKKWHAFRVTDDIPEDPDVAAMVAHVRKTFVSGPDFVAHVNPFNQSRLKRPIDTIVGHTATALHRSNFSHEAVPAVIEGSSHDFLTDAFRVMLGADTSALRGYRYGTHVPPGPIKLEDLYHFVPIGPQIARGTIRGAVIKNQIENSTTGALSNNVFAWTGGWLFNWSGVTFDLDPFGPPGNKATNIRVNGVPLVLGAEYTYASYWYASEPNILNGATATNVTVLTETDGSPLDATEVVVQYLKTLPNQTANPTLNRVRLLQPLPPPQFGFPEMQPLRGVAP